jgi:hypothetical protein
MRNRAKQIAGLTVLVGVLTLAGCEVTDLQWSLSRGYQQIVKDGTVYYCRPERARSPLNVVNTKCLTARELSRLRGILLDTSPGQTDFHEGQ